MSVQILTNHCGRVFGENHHRAKLTDRDVTLIIELWQSGIGYRRIAAIFGVGKTTIQDICIGRRRAHIAMGQRYA